MSDTLFRRVIVPVANEEDARTTAAAVAPYVEESGGAVVAVNVVEKAGGAPDKASVEQRETSAESIFEHFLDELGDVDLDVETEVLYGTDVAETIIAAAHDRDASAIAFTPRGGSRWIKLLTGDVATDLVSQSDLPVVVLPDRAEDDEDT